MVWQSGSDADVAFRQWPGPTLAGLNIHEYVPYIAVLNPMLRLTTSRRWNKLITDHGCYWKRCTFCDVTLDYIRNYQPDDVGQLVSKMKALYAESGESGFHFVDEAAPPALLKALAERLIRERLAFSWRGNVRFDRYFTREVAQVLAAGGCVALTGGIEVASPRLLRLIDKGIDLPQVARVTRALTAAGIMVHAYLIYGFPSQTLEETVDSLEIVRQLFQEGCLHSAFWHHFTLSEHAPIRQDPARFGIEVIAPPPPPEGWFATYAVAFRDATGTDHDALGPGLGQAVAAWAAGLHLTADVRRWFRFDVPETTVPKDCVRSWLGETAVAA